MPKTVPSTARSNLKHEHRKQAFAPRRTDNQASLQSFDVWERAGRISIVGLFAVAVGYVLFVMQEILIPVVLAWVVGAILRPVVEREEA